MKFLPLLLFTLTLARAAEPAPPPGQFPNPNSGTYLAGELVSIDHVNRRGALRFDGDGEQERYYSAPSHEFALLPYATVRYLGATAELVHIPLGTPRPRHLPPAPGKRQTRHSSQTNPKMDIPGKPGPPPRRRRQLLHPPRPGMENRSHRSREKLPHRHPHRPGSP